MARLDGLLEPEEAVVYRSRSPASLWLMDGLWILFISGWLAGLWVRYPLHERPDIMLLALGGVVVAIATGIVLAHVSSRLNSSDWAITNHRIIALDGLLRRSRQEIPLSQIEDAKYEDAKLTLNGGGQTVEVRARRIPADVLTNALTEWFPSIGQPAQRLGRVLDPNETLICRRPSYWNYAYPSVLTAVLIWWAGDPATGLPGWTPRDYAFWGLMLVFAGLLFRDADRWRLAITDRRLLRRLAYDPSRYETFPLSKVEAVPPSPFGDRLFVKLRGREVQIPAKGKDARRIREVIEAAKGTAP